jgi:hypothetical protein
MAKQPVATNSLSGVQLTSDRQAGERVREVEDLRRVLEAIGVATGDELAAR